MKKFIFLSLFLFSFIFLGIFSVKASEFDLSSLGYSSCFDDNDNLVYNCYLDSHGVTVYSTISYNRVSNYFLVSDTFNLYMSTEGDVSSFNTVVSFYDSDYNFISNLSVSLSSTPFEVSRPNGAFYARIRINTLRVYYSDDDLSSVSSLNYAINSLSHTVSQTLTIITTNTILLIATAIFVIGICLYLIWRIVRGG